MHRDELLHRLDRLIEQPTDTFVSNTAERVLMIIEEWEGNFRQGDEWPEPLHIDLNTNVRKVIKKLERDADPGFFGRHMIVASLLSLEHYLATRMR